MDGLDWKPSLVCVYPIRYDGIMTVLKSAPGYSGTMVTYLLEVMNPAICPIMHRAQPSPIRGRDSNGTFSFF